MLFSRGAAAPRAPEAKSPAVPVIATQVACRSRSELEAEFDASWEQAPTLGLALNHGDQPGYEFLLFPQAQPGVQLWLNDFRLNSANKCVEIVLDGR